MDFIAAVVAIVALVLVIKLRRRTAVLEQHVALINQRLAISRGAPPEPAPEPPPEPPPLPVEIPAPPTPTEQIREAAFDQPFQESSAPPSPPPPPLPAPEPAQSFEERFGARWVVWIGGLALPLGGIFLVQYSIEDGLIGPGVRVFLGGLLAASLIAAGEWTRRYEFSLPIASVPNVSMPDMLKAAGSTVAFATFYAAHALYGFRGPAGAFVLLGIVALATLAAALLHGPWLAALGQLGAVMGPLLVATALPNYWALHLSLALVPAASFALARARLWRWLAITAVAFGTLWMFPGLHDLRADAITPHAFHAVAGFALAAALLVSGLFYGPEAEDGRIDPVSSGALSAYLLAAAVL